MKKLSLIFSLMFLVSVAFNSAQAQERKKWSPQAKGAVIGAGTGAAAGAIIHKRNRVAGGVVGGVVGGAAGYGVGKVIDNKQKRAAAEREAEFNRNVAANRAYAYNSSSKRSSSSARKSSNAAKTAAVAAPATMAYTGYTAGQPQIMSMNNLSFLPNEDYGDYSKPYADSEYRRKSW